MMRPNINGANDNKHLNDACEFLKCWNILRTIPADRILVAISTGIVTLGSAAAICGIKPRKLWSDYVALGFLQVYNGDVPVVDFLNITLLLQDVIRFFCKLEKERRTGRPSYQDIVKYIREYGPENDADTELTELKFKQYFGMSSRNAIECESQCIILSRYFTLYPNGAAQNPHFAETISPAQPASEMHERDIKAMLFKRSEVDAWLGIPSAGQEKPVPDIHAVHSQKKRRKHGAISAKNASIILCVSERTVRKWDAGDGRPLDYPGREDALAFETFVNRHNARERLKAGARAANRPVSGLGRMEELGDYEDRET